MVFPLATYTAENGLEWFYDKSAIAFAELDKCRRLLGPLPNFDSGDRGYEGCAAVGRRIYLIRCARAKTVTWLDRDKVGDFDLDSILASDVMCTLSHDHKHSFELAVADTHGDGGIAAGVDLSRTDEEDVFIRRDFGEPKLAIRVERKGETKVTEATKATKRTEETKGTKGTEATRKTREIGRSLRSLPSLSSLEGGSNG